MVHATFYFPDQHPPLNRSVRKSPRAVNQHIVQREPRVAAKHGFVAIDYLVPIQK
jgi:hypothetical protein